MLLHSQYTNDETCYYLQIFALLMLIDYIPHFHEISYFLYNVTKMPRRGCHFILVKLHRQYEYNRKGQEWAPPPPAVLLIRSIKFLCLIDYQDWIAIFKVPPSLK